MLKIPKKLNSERIFLRLYEQGDLDSLFGLISSIQTTQFLDFTLTNKSIEGAKELLTSIIDSYNSDNPIFALSIIHKLSDSYIGLCGLSHTEYSPDIECYYALLPEYRGNGYAIEAMKALFQYAFGDLQLSRITAHINPQNTRGWKVAERAGMKYFGDFPHIPTNQRMMFFVITKKEFEDQNFYYDF